MRGGRMHERDPPLAAESRLPAAISQKQQKVPGVENIDFEYETYISENPRSKRQMWLWRFMHHPKVEAASSLVILLNLLVMVVETDNPDMLLERSELLHGINYVFLAIYTLELVVRMYIYQEDSLKDRWQILDMVVVAADYSMLLLALFISNAPSLSFLRILRLFRLARSVKVMMTFPKLSLMVKGLFHAVEVILWGCCLVSLTLVLFSIFAVQIINPVNQRVKSLGYYDHCERCARAFESVPQSMLTFWQQIVAGDSWGQVCVPIIEEAPWSVFFFAAVFAVVNLMVLNIVLAVVVDSSQKASLEDAADRAKEQHQTYLRYAKQMGQLCHDMDVDHSGELSKQELLIAFQTHPRFQELMYLMQISINDCEAVFCMLDADNSGSIHHEEFITELTKMRTNNQQTVLMFLKFYVREIRDMLAEQQSQTEKLSEQLIEKELNADAAGVTALLEAAPPLEAQPPTVVVQHAKDVPEAAPEPQEQRFLEPPVSRLAFDVEGEIREALRDVQRTLDEDVSRLIQDLSKKADAHSLLLSSIDLTASSLWRVDPPGLLDDPSGGAFANGGNSCLPQLIPPALVPASPDVESKADLAAVAAADPMPLPAYSNGNASSARRRRRSPPPPVPLCGPPERLCAEVQKIGPSCGTAGSLLAVPTEQPALSRGVEALGGAGGGGGSRR